MSLICFKLLEMALHSLILAIFSETEVLIIIPLVHFLGGQSEAMPLLLIFGSARFLYRVELIIP